MKPGLAREPDLKTSIAYLIRRDVELQRHHKQHRLPPTERSKDEEDNDAVDLAAEIHRPTLIRHGANCTKSPFHQFVFLVILGFCEKLYLSLSFISG